MNKYFFIFILIALLIVPVSASYSEQWSVNLPTSIYGCAINDAGTIVACEESNGNTTVFDSNGARLWNTPGITTSSGNKLVIDPTNTYLIRSEYNNLTIRSLSSGALIGKTYEPNGIQCFGFANLSSSNNRLVFGSSYNVTVLNIPTSTLIARRSRITSGDDHTWLGTGGAYSYGAGSKTGCGAILSGDGSLINIGSSNTGNVSLMRIGSGTTFWLDLYQYPETGIRSLTTTAETMTTKIFVLSQGTILNLSYLYSYDPSYSGGYENYTMRAYISSGVQSIVSKGEYYSVGFVGSIVYIYRYTDNLIGEDTLTLDGSYSTGGDINDIDISKNQLYSSGGSDDGGIYIFGKQESSGWALIYNSELSSTVETVALSEDGLSAVAGRADGSITFYSDAPPSPQEEYYTHIYATYDSQKFVGQNITIYESTTFPYSWVVSEYVGTDSDGHAVALTTSQYYYKAEPVNYPTYSVIWQASTSVSQRDIMLSMHSVPAIPGNYQYTVATSLGNITFNYVDINTAKLISLKITNVSTGYAVCQTSWATKSSINHIHNLTAGGVYKVDLVMQRTSGTVRDTKFIRIGSIVPAPPIDQYTLDIFLTIALMLIAGLATFIHAHKIAIAVVMLAWLFYWIGWYTVNPLAMMLASFVAVLFAFNRGGRV